MAQIKRVDGLLLKVIRTGSDEQPIAIAFDLNVAVVKAFGLSAAKKFCRDLAIAISEEEEGRDLADSFSASLVTGVSSEA